MDPSLDAGEVALLVAHLCATWFMVGLIWMVQRVTYPGFAHVDDDGIAAHAHHTRAISPVVGPAMAVEGVTAILLVVPGVPGVPTLLALAGLAVLGLVQLSTIAVQVPSHGRLSQGMDAIEVARLVRGNWIRTIGWDGSGRARGGRAPGGRLTAGTAAVEIASRPSDRGAWTYAADLDCWVPSSG